MLEHKWLPGGIAVGMVVPLQLAAVQAQAQVLVQSLAQVQELAKALAQAQE